MLLLGDLTESTMVYAKQDLADVKAEEDAHVIASTKIFALENWGRSTSFLIQASSYYFGFSLWEITQIYIRFVDIVSYYFALNSTDLFCFLGELCVV